MSLRLKLLLIVITIVGLIALGEGLLLRSLTRDLERDLGEAVASVSRSLIAEIRFVRFDTGEGTPDVEVVGEKVKILKFSSPAPDDATNLPGDGLTPGRRRIGIIGEMGNETEISDILSELGVDLGEDERSLILEGPTHTRTLDIPIEGVHATMREFARKLLLGSAGVALVGLLLAVLLAHRVTTPLRYLALAAADVGEGQLGVQIDAPAGGEVGAALQAFNTMSQRLADLEADAVTLRANQHLSELGEIGRGLAHSLRNPLNTLGLAVGGIEDLAASEDKDPERASRLAGDARRQISRIDRALRSFLALSTGPVGPTENETIDLVDLARDVALEAMQTARAQAGQEAGGAGPVRIQVEAPAGEAQVGGVEAELRAAVHALVINAVEASPPGGEVVVTVTAEGNEGTVSVRDWGPGIAEEIRSRLFTPHVTTKPQGAGIGLYLAHRIATNRYRGSLTVSDGEGGGTVANLVVRDRVEPPS